MSLARRAFLRGASAAAIVSALPAVAAVAPASAALKTALRFADFEAASAARRAYQRALLQQICDTLAIDYATFTASSVEATAALIRQRLAAAYPRSPIASAGARQGLPTAILIAGAAS